MGSVPHPAKVNYKLVGFHTIHFMSGSLDYAVDIGGCLCVSLGGTLSSSLLCASLCALEPHPLVTEVS